MAKYIFNFKICLIFIEKYMNNQPVNEKMDYNIIFFYIICQRDNLKKRNILLKVGKLKIKLQGWINFSLDNGFRYSSYSIKFLK